MEPTSKVLDIQKQSLPPGLEGAGDRAVRDWLLRSVEAEIRTRGDVSPALHVIHEDHLIVVPLRLDPGDEPWVAAAWHALGERDGARHRIRVGTVLIGEPGARRTAAFAMTWEPHLDPAVFDLPVGSALPAGLPGFGARWWLAWRLFGEGDGGTGVLHGGWVEREGAGLEDLEPPFRELLDSEGTTMRLEEVRFEEGKGLDMTTELIMRHPEAPVPVGVSQHLAFLSAFIDEQALSHGMDCLWVWAMRDDWLEWWKIRGVVPCSLDELLRNVAAHSGAQGVGATLPGAAQTPDGVTRRTIETTLEIDGQRASRAIALQFGPDGRPSVAGAFTAPVLDVPPAARWIGVTPSFDLKIKTEGMVRTGLSGGVAEG